MGGMPRKRELLNGGDGEGKSRARVISGVSAMHSAYRDFLAELAIEVQGAMGELSWEIGHGINKRVFEGAHKVIMGAWAGLRHFIYSDVHFLRGLNENEVVALKRADEVLFTGETKYITPEAFNQVQRFQNDMKVFKEKLEKARRENDQASIEVYEALIKRYSAKITNITRKNMISSPHLAANDLILVGDIMLRFLKEKGLINPFQMTKTVVEE